MQDINNYTATGRVASDVKLQHTPNGTACVEFRVAVNDREKGEDGNYTDRANFFSIKVWQGQAEACANGLEKGQAIAFSGRWRYDSWGPEDNRKSRVYIVADIVRFGEKPKGADQPE